MLDILVLCVCVCMRTCACVHMCTHSLSSAQLFVTLWTVAHQPLCPWNSPGKNPGVGCHPLLQGSSWPRVETRSLAFLEIACIGRQVLYCWVTREARLMWEVRAVRTMKFLPGKFHQSLWGLCIFMICISRPNTKDWIYHSSLLRSKFLRVVMGIT